MTNGNTNNVLSVAQSDFFDAENGIESNRINVAKIAVNMIPPGMSHESVVATLTLKLEEDLAQAYLSAFTLIKLGVDVHAVANAVFSDTTPHEIFIL